MFFSPWELDAQGYGSNVKAYYLNITNPADEQTGYKALRKFQGQNNAGVKAREYLESLGYDGVNNENEEYIAFNSNQIKLTDNLNPTDKSDIRYSKDTLFAKALTSDEIKKYNNAIATGVDNGLRISDNSLLVECENKSEYQYKYVMYDDFEDGQRITDVYAIGRIDTNVDDDVPSQYHTIANIINKTKEQGYDNKRYVRQIFKSYIKNTSYVLSEYNHNTSKFNVIGRGSTENGTNTLDKSIGRGSVGSDTRFSDKQSRNTRLTLDDNIEDVNEAFLSAVKVLQNVHIDDIDLSSEVVNKAEKAAKHIQDEVKKSGYRTQKMTGKGSLRSIATELSDKYGKVICKIYNEFYILNAQFKYLKGI